MWVRVWVRAGSLGLLSYLLWCWGLCGVVLVVVLQWLVLLFGFWFGFGIGFWVWVRFEVEEDLVPELRPCVLIWIRYFAQWFSPV